MMSCRNMGFFLAPSHTALDLFFSVACCDGMHAWFLRMLVVTILTNSRDTHVIGFGIDCRGEAR